MQCDKLKENCVTVSVTWRCEICVNITFAWGHQWHLGTHLFISGSDTITPALSPHEPLTSITHYHSYYLLFIPKITRLYSSLLSSQSWFSLVVRMSGFWWEPRYESPGPELHRSLISWYFWQEFVMWPLASWVSEAWREGETNEWRGPGPGGLSPGVRSVTVSIYQTNNPHCVIVPRPL